MDSTVIYSKTSKGTRLRSSLFGGLSSQLMKILALVDGKSNAVEILTRLDDCTEKKLALALMQLEKEGYIKLVAMTVSDDWLRVSRFSPMLVEEVNYKEEIEAKAEKETLLEVERKAKAELNAQIADELKVREVVEQIRVKEKSKAEVREKAKEKERLEKARIAREAEETLKKIEAETYAKAEEARLEFESKAKEETEALLKAESKALEDAEKIRAKAEAKAKFEAEERIAVERIAREAEETLKKIEAETHAKAEKEARLELERKAKKETETRLKAEIKALEDAEKIRAKAEAKAKFEAEERIAVERIAREAEETLKKIEIETRAKVEEKARVDAENKAKAKQKVKLEGELKAQRVAEQIRAKEKARREMVRIACEAAEVRKKFEAEAFTKAEEKSRVDAEYKAKSDAEARLKAELKAREDAEKTRVESEAAVKDSAHHEMERLAHEAEEMREISDAEVLTKTEEEALLEVERIAREKAEMQARVKAEQGYRKEAERVAKKDEKAALSIQNKAQQKAEKQERAEVKRLAREWQEENVKASAHGRSSAGIKTFYIGKWISIAIKVMLIYLPLIALLLVGLLHLINLSVLIKPIEMLVSESIGEPVAINEVHASLWPQPHLVLGDIAVGENPGLKNAGLKIETVNIFPDTFTLFEKVKVVKSLEISGMKIERNNWGQPLKWINSSSKAEHLKIERINFKKIDLNILDLELASFEGEIGLGESREFKNIDLNSADHTLSVQITPQGSGFNVGLTAYSWPLPVNPKIMFDKLKVKATLNQNQIDFSQIEGSIYGGSITAKASISWSKQWIASGNFKLTNVSLPQILKAFSSDGSIDGKLNLTGNFSSKSDKAAKISDDSDVTANFEIGNGKINGIDLARAVMSRGDKSLAGYATNFDKLTGSLRAKGGHFQYKKLLLQAAQLQVQGNLDIQPNQDISGSISANLVAQSRRLQTRFELTGKVSNVKQQ
jgi:hypothetical protein